MRDPRFLAQQGRGLDRGAERPPGIQERADHPAVELLLSLRRHSGRERPVARRAAEDGVHLQRDVRVVDLPVVASRAVVEGGRSHSRVTVASWRVDNGYGGRCCMTAV